MSDVKNDSRENARFGEVWKFWELLREVAGPLSAWLIIAFLIAFFSASVGFLEVKTEWLAPLLEVAITPVALVVSLMFGTAAVLLTNDVPFSENWSRDQVKALVGGFLLVGVGALGAILLYLALVDAWWAEGILSPLGVFAITSTALGIVSVGRLGLILTGLDSSPQQLQTRRSQPGKGLNAPLRWGSLFLTLTLLSVPLAAAFQDKVTVAVFFLVVTVVANVAGTVLSGVGAWQVWRKGQRGKWQSITALVWGLTPWVIAVFYFS